METIHCADYNHSIQETNSARDQGLEIQTTENSRKLQIFHKFLMNLDLAPKPNQNDTQLVMFSTDFDRV